MENINNDVPQHQPYRNEKVFNSGKTALELNYSETNGSVNLILAGPLASKPGAFDWTGQKVFSTKLSDDEVIALCMAFLRLTREAVLKDKKTKHHNKQVYKNVKVTFDGKSTAMLEGGVVAINKDERDINFIHKISIDPAACLRLGLFLLSVILARNPGVPSDAVLTCMRLNANAQLQK